MIGVLLCSRKAGRKSAWAAVRGSKQIHVTGMSEGDMVQIELSGPGHDGVVFQAMNDDSSFNIPNGVQHIQAVHVKVGIDPNVSVDLV